MTEILDADFNATYADRPAFGRVVRGVALDRGLSNARATDLLCGEEAALALGAGHTTVRDVVRALGADAEVVGEAARFWEKADAVVEAAYERASSPIMLEQVDRHGMILLDQSAPAGLSDSPMRRQSPVAVDPLQTDIGKALTDPAERERRLARARKLSGRYQGDEGRRAFDEEDRGWLEGGKDIVRTLERHAAVTHAKAAADRVGAQLEAAFSAAGKERQRLKTLEAEISNMTGPQWMRDAARKELDGKMNATMREPVRLLESLAGEQQSTVGLGEPLLATSKLSPKAREIAARIDGRGARTRVEYLKLLEQDPSAADVDQTANAEVFLAVLDMDEPPGAPEPPAKLEVPAGVYGPSLTTHERVRSRMRELDAGEEQYGNVLQQILREDAM